MSKHKQSCRTCKWLRVKPDKRGRIIPRKNNIYLCKYQFGHPPIVPDSARLLTWPPIIGWMAPDEGANCPCWAQREKAR